MQNCIDLASSPSGLIQANEIHDEISSFFRIFVNIHENIQRGKGTWIPIFGNSYVNHALSFFKKNFALTPDQEVYFRLFATGAGLAAGIAIVWGGYKLWKYFKSKKAARPENGRKLRISKPTRKNRRNVMRNNKKKKGVQSKKKKQN